jgi:hypothetical protein
VGDLGDATDATSSVSIIDRSGPRLDFSCDAASVETRAPLRCTVSATHPTGEPVDCVLSFDDGRAPLRLGDCAAAPQAFEVRTSSPGTLQLVASARDVSDRAASHAVTVAVTGLPNHAPVLSSFTAAALTGKAPLSTSLRWTVSDPEGDALRCALDVGADGTVEEPTLDCAALPYALSLRAPGMRRVRLTVTDSGDLSTSAELSFDVAPPTADLRVERVELGQAVVKASLPLVSGKRTLLRVVALANEPALSAAVAVEARQGATVLGTQRLTGPGQVPQQESPADLSRSYSLALPPAWVVPGVSLRVRLDVEDVVLEVDETNNEATVSPVVTPARELHLSSVPVVNGGNTGQPQDAEATVTAVWPVTSVETKVRAPFTWTQEVLPTDASSWAALLGGLAQAKGSDGSDRNYYGWLRAGFGGGVAGIGYLGQSVATGRDDNLQVMAHELGHNFGRNHAPCGGAAGADPGYPYAGAKIGTWGWSGNQLLSPNQFVDLMSYCNPAWVSDYSYEAVQDFMAGRGEFEPGAMLPSVLGEDVLLFAGRLTARGAVLADVQRLHGTPRPARDSGDAVLVLRRVDGVTQRVPVALAATSEGDERHFVAVLPFVAELRSWSVEVNGAVVAERTVDGQPFAPRVEATRVGAERVRVTWTGARSVLVAHVAPSGERTTLTVDARGGAVDVFPVGLVGGTFEVSASDGVRSQATRLDVW